MLSSAQTLIPFPADVIGTGLIYRSAIPGCSSLDKIQNQLKVHTIVQLCFDHEFNDYSSPEALKQYTTRQFNVIKFCIPDFKVPASVSDTWALVDRIIALTREGKNVLVHCVGGRGRTGLILALVAMKVFGFEPRQAIQWLRKFIPGGVESDVQERFLVTCHEELRQQHLQEHHHLELVPADSAASKSADPDPMPHLLVPSSNTLEDLLGDESASAEAPITAPFANDEALVAAVANAGDLAHASAAVTVPHAEGENFPSDQQTADKTKSAEEGTAVVEMAASSGTLERPAKDTRILSERSIEEEQAEGHGKIYPVIELDADIESQRKRKGKCNPTFSCCILQ